MKRARARTPKIDTRHQEFMERVRARTRTPAFKRRLRDLIVDLCKIDTTPNPDPGVMRRAEAACFDIIERELARLRLDGARAERLPIDPAIQAHEHYSLLHYSKTPRRPAGLTPKQAYAGRSNLVFLIPGAGVEAAPGRSVALNAHVDVVAPYFPPHTRGDIIHGRGTCDDKGPVAALVAALAVFDEVMVESGLRPNRNALAMFVIEEETGGNGSLSLAIDEDLKRLYDSVMVLEITGLKLHPANRGAVWYKAQLQPPPGLCPLELAAAVVLEMEAEGAAIRAESHHPLFPQRPVQTCHGIIGPFGEHPSRVCGAAAFDISFARPPGPRAERIVRDCIDAGLETYTGLYGDKTRATDAATGKPLVARHCDIRRSGNRLSVTVHGATGHMGAVRQLDGAITKMAHLVRALARSRAKIEASAGTPFALALAGKPRSPRLPLTLEGGQGFLPTHDISEIMERMRAAAARGADSLLRAGGLSGRGSDLVRVTYEKLHNVAFDGDPGSRTMRNAIGAARDAGIPVDDPILGWTVSCDARIFATQYPGMDVVTFGPGKLAHAHADDEQIDMGEVLASVEFLCAFLLRQTGAIPRSQTPNVP